MLIHFIFCLSFICKVGLYLSISLSNLKCFRIDKLMQNPDGHNYFINLENHFMFFFFLKLSLRSYITFQKFVIKSRVTQSQRYLPRKLLLWDLYMTEVDVIFADKN